MKVSVLLPFLNAAHTLEQSLLSVLQQDFDDFEVILVNNGSDDESAAIAGKYIRTGDKIKLIDEPVRGIAKALNTGLNHCRGEYIARMDADDISLPGRLKIQSGYLDLHPETGLISGLVNNISSISNNEGMSAYVHYLNSTVTRDEIFHHRFVESPFAHPSVMFRKNLITRFGKYSEENIPEDYELWLRWFSKGVIMEKLPVPVIDWHDHPARASRKMISYSKDAFSQIRMKYLAEYLKDHLKSNLKLLIWGGGKLSRKKAESLIAYGIRVDGFIDVNPKREISGYEVIHYLDLPPPGHYFILSLVSNRGKYLEIAEYLQSRGYNRGDDFLMAS